MTVEQESSDSGLVTRAKAIILSPKLEWPVIEAESASIKSILVPYAVLLTAIGPLATLIGGQIFPVRLFGVVYRPDLMAGMLHAVVGWGLGLVAVYLLALIIDALAPSFDGQQDRVQATKLAVYSMTPAWVAAILGLVPALAWLGGLLGLYSLYLFYLGLPQLMKAAPSKTMIYTVVVVIAAIILWMVVGAILGSMIGMGALATAGRFSIL